MGKNKSKRTQKPHIFHNPRSDYSARLTEQEDALMRCAERITHQFDMDTMQEALNEFPKTEFGYDLIMEFTEFWLQIRRQHEGCLQRGPEQDYHQAKLDEKLFWIARNHPENHIPFKKRYPELKKPI